MDDLNERAARNRKIKHAVFIVLLIVLFVCFIFPFILVLINVFKTKADITADRVSWIYAEEFPGSHGEDELLEFLCKFSFYYDHFYNPYDPAGFYGCLCDRA